MTDRYPAVPGKWVIVLVRVLRLWSNFPTKSSSGSEGFLFAYSSQVTLQH